MSYVHDSFDASGRTIETVGDAFVRSRANQRNAYPELFGIVFLAGCIDGVFPNFYRFWFEEATRDIARWNNLRFREPDTEALILFVKDIEDCPLKDVWPTDIPWPDGLHVEHVRITFPSLDRARVAHHIRERRFRRLARLQFLVDVYGRLEESHVEPGLQILRNSLATTGWHDERYTFSSRFWLGELVTRLERSITWDWPR